VPTPPLRCPTDGDYCGTCPEGDGFQGCKTCLVGTCRQTEDSSTECGKPICEKDGSLVSGKSYNIRFVPVKNPVVSKIPAIVDLSARSLSKPSRLVPSVFASV
jgi:hypothetical protein